ncbi:MAG: response regulator transcription factor [Candidatus Eremiobacteraeota bacterium]|nr:response regulator transcription factor [Candidatus Eremiobacteraeota bacterium]
MNETPQRGRSRIAVVDDEPRIRELLELTLAHGGYDVRSAADGQAALSLVREWQPDLVILDVMLPKIDGIALLPMIRRLTDVPVVMLSAKGEIEDRVAGLSHGADDYLSKPFEIAELLAHVEAKLRRPHLETPTVLHFADLTMDLQTHVVEREGRELDLSPLEYRLLATLLRRPRRVFTREELLDLAWGDDAEVTPAAVERYISYLRAKVDDGFDRRLIHTVRGFGYVLREDA